MRTQEEIWDELQRLEDSAEHDTTSVRGMRQALMWALGVHGTLTPSTMLASRRETGTRIAQPEDVRG